MTFQTSTLDSPRNSNPLTIPDLRPLPPYLRRTEPMEPEDLPLQLALLTMEVANQRKALDRLAFLFRTIGEAIEPATSISSAPSSDA